MAGALSDSDNGDMNDYLLMKQVESGSMPGQQSAPPLGPPTTVADSGMGGAPLPVPTGGISGGGNNISGNDPGAARGALSTPGMQPAASPQEWRDLQLLEAARGMATAPHTGRAAEGLQNEYTNLADVAHQQLVANAAMRAKIAEIQAAKEADISKNKDTVQGRIDVANIMAGKNSQEQLTPDEISDMGLPPGSVASRNKFGQIHVIHSPPASQQELTGYDANGNATYAQPGAVLTPKIRSDMQGYMRSTEGTLPKLNDMISTMQDPKNNVQSALGVSGSGEEVLNATAGQVASAFGRKTPLFPQDTELRQNLAQLNEQLAPAISADPRMSHLSREEVHAMLPSLGHSESAGEALTKLKTIRDTMQQRRAEYGEQLQGKNSISDTSHDSEGSGGSSGTFTPEQVQEEMRRRKLAQ